MKEHKLTPKYYMILLFACFAVAGVLLVAIACNALVIKKVNIGEYTRVENAVYSLGEITNSGRIVQFPEAYVYEPGCTVGAFDVHIALHCTNTDEVYVLPSQYVEREDIEEEPRSGVHALGILRLMGYQPSYEYEIYFLMENDGNKKYVDTGVTL